MRSTALFLPTLLVVLSGCVLTGCERASQPEPVAHLAACVAEAPDKPCARLPGYDPAYWLAEQAERSDVYLGAAELCLGALLDGAVAGRRGACADVYDAYLVDARAGRRDLGGRIPEADAGRALGLVYSAQQARRSADMIRAMGADSGRTTTIRP